MLHHMSPIIVLRLIIRRITAHCRSSDLPRPHGVVSLIHRSDSEFANQIRKRKFSVGIAQHPRKGSKRAPVCFQRRAKACGSPDGKSAKEASEKFSEFLHLPYPGASTSARLPLLRGFARKCLKHLRGVLPGDG